MWGWIDSLMLLLGHYSYGCQWYLCIDTMHYSTDSTEVRKGKNVYEHIQSSLYSSVAFEKHRYIKLVSSQVGDYCNDQIASGLWLASQQEGSGFDSQHGPRYICMGYLWLLPQFKDFGCIKLKV